MSCTHEVGINNLYTHYFMSYFCVISIYSILFFKCDCCCCGHGILFNFDPLISGLKE